LASPQPIFTVSPAQTPALKTLPEIDQKWRAYLSDDSCPPVLGLAPLSEEESHLIGQLVAAELNQHSRLRSARLFSLLEKFPACMAVWLSRKAGEAYEAGAFWDKFFELIGVTLPIYDREPFGRRFQLACSDTMSCWLPPKEMGSQRNVAEFLYQAGLPLERCARFAEHFRKVERIYGLPDENAPDAGDQLRDWMLDTLQSVPVPTLRTALRGPAGARICEVALLVVVNREFEGINPRLGQELDRAFEHAERGTLRRSTHQPYLRLGDDLGSVEIVGPRQDASVVGVSGLTWLLNGRRFSTMRNEELVEKVTDETRVTIEPLGLIGGAASPRNFTLRLDDRTQPFILFDERTRRERRVAGFTQPGSYWLLHRSSDSLSGAEQRYDWPDGERSLSFFTVRPGTVTELEGYPRGLWRFIPKVVPFFEVSGGLRSSSDQGLISFGWSELPVIWMPVEYGKNEVFAQWHVSAGGCGPDRKLAITATSEEVGGMVKCLIQADEFLATLPPAMYRLTLTLHRSGRIRNEASSEYWLWQGLRMVDSRGFHLSGFPGNLVHDDSAGFGFNANAILHRRDQNHLHELSFEVSGLRCVFKWPQPGIYVDVLDRRPGQRTISRAGELGEVFSVAPDSTRWLRLWLTGETGWEILVGGKAWQSAVGEDRRDFFEFSLASLAITFPDGGDILLKSSVHDLLIARFTSPLKPVDLEMKSDGFRRGFKFQFAEPVKYFRPTAWDLSSGVKKTFEPQLEPQDANSFSMEGFPCIECTSESEPTTVSSVDRHFVTVWVPTREWPIGLWLIELEVRRNEGAEWQAVLVNGREFAPVAIDATADGASFRSSLLKASLRTSTDDIDLSLDATGHQDLHELLVDLMTLRKREYASLARREIRWLKDALRTLSKIAGRMLRQQGGETLQTALLNMACQDPQHSGFVYLPELLALPACDYSELPYGDPLNDALRRCGRLAGSDSIAALVADDPDFLDFSVLTYFSNLAVVAAHDPASDGQPDFQCFALERFFKDVVREIDINRLATEWSGSSALGSDHRLWAFSELVNRYEQSTDDGKIAAANTLMNLAPHFRSWLQSRLQGAALLPVSAWKAPWLRFVVSQEIDFLEKVPYFASLFALAARASAAGILPIDETLRWLEKKVERRYMAEEGIAALVGLAPELFGHQLLFWELMIRTAPH
jgi:hypothetical protein